MRQVQLAPESASAAIVPALLLSLVLAAGPVRPVLAANLPFAGSVTTNIIAPSGLPLATVTVTGSSVATVNGSGGGNHLNQLALVGGTFGTVGYLTPVPQFAPLITSVQVTNANGAGFFAGTTTMGAGPLGGVMPILGVAKVCFFGSGGGCASATGNLSVPLSVIGSGGAAYASNSIFEVTVQGAPWTTASVTYGMTPGGSTAFVTGFAHGPASATSSTANASGALQLVTPFFIYSNLVLNNVTASGYTVMTLHFVPEPGTLLLLGSGTLALAAFGRRVRSQRR